MVHDLPPVAGNWYQNLKTRKVFQVLKVDRDEDVIEIQHFDGNLEEVDQMTWYNYELELAEPPEDWTGPYDDIKKDDLGYTEV